MELGIGPQSIFDRLSQGKTGLTLHCADFSVFWREIWYQDTTTSAKTWPKNSGEEHAN